MKISGFTLVRHGVEYDYPFIESISSLLPLVDELIVNIGRGSDLTLARVQELKQTMGGEKIQIIESDWPLDDPTRKKGGLILSEQTNLALDACTGDWCVYLQADEVIHEEDVPKLRQALERNHARPEIEGLLFDYVHFYGSYDVTQRSRSAYRREVRAIRRASGARSVGDAQSFRKPDGSKLRVCRPSVRAFHYGWVRSPEAMREKTFFMDQLYHGDPDSEAKAQRVPHTGDNYRYKRIWGLMPFTGSHPAVMAQRIRSKGWHWDLKHSPFEWRISDAKKIALDLLERMTGHRFFEYRSYRLID